DRTLSGLRESHTCAALPDNALIRDLVMLRLAAETVRSDFLELFPGVHRRRMRGPRHGVGRLAAAGNAGEWQVFRGVAPDDIALFPRDTENFGARAVDVDHRLRPQVADAGLEADPAIGRDHEKSVE